MRNLFKTRNERSAACSAVYEFDRRIRIRRETETPREEHPPLIIKSYMRRKLFEERPPGPRTVLALHISLSPPSALHLPTTTDHIGLLDLTSFFLLLLLTWLPNQKRKEKRHIHPGKPKPQLSTLNFLIFTYIVEPHRVGSVRLVCILGFGILTSSISSKPSRVVNFGLH